MGQYISKDVLVAEIEKRLKANSAFDEVGDEAWAEDKGMCEAYRSILSFLDTLEVKEIPEYTHTECKKIKKLCEIQRYDGDGKAYSVMLPDIRLFMNKINEIIDAVSNIDSRLLIVEQRKRE